MVVRKRKSLLQVVTKFITKKYRATKKRLKNFLGRRPHRSFRKTARRDYVRSLRLPGYYAFTFYVHRTIKKHFVTFLLIVVIYSAIQLLLGGLSNQDMYNQLSDVLKGTGQDIFTGSLGKVGEASLLVFSTFVSGSSTLSVDQQIYLSFSLLMVWLTTVWLLREYMLNRKPRLRDGLYNSGAPIVASMVLCVIMVIQLLPVAVTGVIYSALSSAGLIANGFGSMLFWVFASIVGALVLYWITSTILALVIVTLPGMYPLRALRASGDLVVGRRLRILYRLLWGAGVVVVAWVIVMIPLVFINSAITNAWPAFASFPLMPAAAAVMGSLSIIWFSSYTYLLYRRIVDDDTKPA